MRIARDGRYRLEKLDMKPKVLVTREVFDETLEYLARFFFGDELGDKVRQNNWVILPECTGIWWRRID